MWPFIEWNNPNKTQKWTLATIYDTTEFKIRIILHLHEIKVGQSYGAKGATLNQWWIYQLLIEYISTRKLGRGDCTDGDGEIVTLLSKI
jgi:hypothetical protein